MTTSRLGKFRKPMYICLSGCVHMLNHLCSIQMYRILVRQLPRMLVKKFLAEKKPGLKIAWLFCFFFLTMIDFVITLKVCYYSPLVFYWISKSLFIFNFLHYIYCYRLYILNLFHHSPGM